MLQVILNACNCLIHCLIVHAWPHAPYMYSHVIHTYSHMTVTPNAQVTQLNPMVTRTNTHGSHILQERLNIVFEKVND